MRSVDPLIQVQVVRIGTKKPARVLVRFASDECESREESVPPTRLKVPWSSVDEFTAREQKWDAVIDASPITDTAADYASSHVFDELIDPRRHSVFYSYCSLRPGHPLMFDNLISSGTHSLGTRLINSGVPQHVIQRLLTHASQP